MAYFRKRSGAWEATIDKKGFSRISRTFDTKSEAEAWASVKESEMVRGVFVSKKEAENTTLFEALDRYSSEVSSKKKGYYQEFRRIENLKKQNIAKRYLATVQGKDIAEYRDERSKSVTDATVRRELTILSHVFEVAIKEWGINGLSNPVKSIRLPSGRGEKRERRLSSKEEEKLLAACDEYGGDLPHLVRLAIETAMRRKEISEMAWNQVDLENRTIFIPDTKNSDKRIVPLSTEAVRILSGLPRRILGAVWEMKPGSITHAFIRSISRARSAYDKECEEKKEKTDQSFLVDLTFHDLRHEATSRLFELGLSTEEVKNITGHKDYKMLARYTHLKAENIIEKMDRLKRCRS